MGKSFHCVGALAAGGCSSGDGTGTVSFYIGDDYTWGRAKPRKKCAGFFFSAKQPRRKNFALRSRPPPSFCEAKTRGENFAPARNSLR